MLLLYSFKFHTPSKKVVCVFKIKCLLEIMKGFRSENFEYKNKVRYHVRPVIDGTGETFVKQVGLYPSNDYVYSRGHDPGHPEKRKLAIGLPYYSFVEGRFIHELNGADLHVLSVFLSAHFGEKVNSERIDSIKLELLEIRDLEMRLEKEMPGYRENDK